MIIDAGYIDYIMALNSTKRLLNDGFNYVTRNRALRRTAIGGVLTGLSILVLPAVYVFGYYIDMIQSSMHGDNTPPEFTTDDISERVKKGLVAFIISIIYAIPFFVIFFAGVAVVIAEGVPEYSFLALAGFAGLLSMVATLYLLLLVPAGFALYAGTGNISAAFSFSSMREVILTREYLTVYVLSLVLTGVTTTISGTIGIIPIIGTLLVGFIQFPALVISYRMYATAIADTSPAVLQQNADRTPIAE